MLTLHFEVMVLELLTSNTNLSAELVFKVVLILLVAVISNSDQAHAIPCFNLHLAWRLTLRGKPSNAGQLCIAVVLSRWLLFRPLSIRIAYHQAFEDTVVNV